MKCQGLLEGKIRCKNKGKNYVVKMQIREEIISKKIVLCEIHVALQQMALKIQELEK